jgi:CBS domain-containing protein
LDRGGTEEVLLCMSLECPGRRISKRPIRFPRLPRRRAGKFTHSTYLEEVEMPSTTVKDVMTSGPTSIASDATVVDAGRHMLSEDVGSLPVVDGDKLVGMITDRDIVLQVVAKDLDPHKVMVSDVASKSPVTAEPDEPLDAALQRMANEQVRRLPVVRDGRVVGILAQADIARTARPESTGRLVEEISEQQAGAR